MDFLKAFWRHTTGGGLVEYTLILALVVIGCIAVLTSLQGSISTTLSSVVSAI